MLYKIQSKIIITKIKIPPDNLNSQDKQLMGCNQSTLAINASKPTKKSHQLIIIQQQPSQLQNESQNPQHRQFKQFSTKDNTIIMKKKESKKIFNPYVSQEKNKDKIGTYSDDKTKIKANHVEKNLDKKQYQEQDQNYMSTINTHATSTQEFFDQNDRYDRSKNLMQRSPQIHRSKKFRTSSVNGQKNN